MPQSVKAQFQGVSAGSYRGTKKNVWDSHAMKVVKLLVFSEPSGAAMSGLVMATDRVRRRDNAWLSATKSR
jgi:hypothetical protein